MGEKVAEAKTIIVHYFCDECNNGKMLCPEGSYNYNLDTKEFSYNHICETCGNEKVFKMKYPYLKQVPLENLRDPKDNEK